VQATGHVHVKGKTAHKTPGSGVAPRSSNAPAQPAGRHAVPASDTSLPFTGLPLLLLTLIAGSMLALGVSVRALGRLERFARR
jgi:hypothetical protein